MLEPWATWDIADLQRGSSGCQVEELGRLLQLPELQRELGQALQLPELVPKLGEERGLGLDLRLAAAELPFGSDKQNPGPCGCL